MGICKVSFGAKITKLSKTIILSDVMRSADFFFFFFSEKIRLDILCKLSARQTIHMCKLSARQTIHMKCNLIFSEK